MNRETLMGRLVWLREMRLRQEIAQLKTRAAALSQIERTRDQACAAALLGSGAELRDLALIGEVRLESTRGAHKAAAQVHLASDRVDHAHKQAEAVRDAQAGLQREKRLNRDRAQERIPTNSRAGSAAPVRDANHMAVGENTSITMSGAAKHASPAAHKSELEERDKVDFGAELGAMLTTCAPPPPLRVKAGSAASPDINANSPDAAGGSQSSVPVPGRVALTHADQSGPAAAAVSGFEAALEAAYPVLPAAHAMIHDQTAAALYSRPRHKLAVSKSRAGSSSVHVPPRAKK